MFQVFIGLNLNGDFFPSHICYTFVELGSSNISPPQHRTLFLSLVVGFLLFFNADVPTVVLDRNVNRCNPHAPLPGKLYLQVYRCV